MRVLIIILWFLLGLFYWNISKKCCAPAKEEITEVTPIPVKKVQKLTPISFARSDDKPNTDPMWVRFRDSLVNNLKEGSVLSVKGLYFNDEKYEGTDDLGMARAKNVLKLFDNLGEDRVKLSSGTKGDNWLQDEVNNLIAFRYLKQTAKIKEVDDKTIIYFEFNSTRKLADAEIEKYLDDVAERVVASAEKVNLVGHTDDIGSDASNILLGEKRALKIKDYLIRKGVNPSNIIVSSRGERSPIAVNETEAGRKKNRRVELKIIK